MDPGSSGPTLAAPGPISQVRPGIILRSRLGWLLAALFIASAALRWRADPLQVGSNDFDVRVLQSPIPVLVVFNTAPDCDGAEPAIRQVRKRWSGDFAVFNLNTRENPQIADRYGVGSQFVFAKFEGGRIVKREKARPIIDRIKARNDGYFTNDGMIGELEYFMKHR